MRRILLTLALVLTLGATTGYAQNLGIAVRGGTNGIGGDLSYAIKRQLNVRAGGGYFAYGTTRSTEDELTIEYEVDLTLLTGYVLVDFFPLPGPFRVTGGFRLIGHEVSASGLPIEPYTVEGRTFSVAQLGSLSGDVSIGNGIAPYLGLGIGNPTRGGRVGFVMDLGFAYTNTPTISMSGTGMIGPTADIDQVDALQSILDDYSEFKFWPDLSLGFYVRL